MNGRLAIGIDIGHTNLRAGLVDQTGAVRDVIRERTDISGGPEGVLEQIVRSAERLRGKHEVAGIGVGIAGQCDIARGVVRCGPNLFWPDVPLQQWLNEEMKLPVILRNDVVMATVGEWRYGAGRGCHELVMLLVGTGIGGGAVVNGKLLQGATGCGGHFGHISVQMDGPLCGCGRPGCVEAYASGSGLAARAREDPCLSSSMLANTLRLDGMAVAQAALAGDPLALRLRDEAATALSSAVSNVINCFNPQRAILGGAVLNGLPQLFDLTVRGAMEQCLPSHRDHLEMKNIELGDLSGIIGAASWVHYPL